jgi:DNA-binding transcriptional LysR family regulator
MDQILRIFVTVADRKNFTRTAEELCMTQPAVSQHIQTLERAIGAKLLERSNKFVRLTKAGEIVYHHATEILGLYTRMHCLVDDLLHTTHGVLSVGASYTFGEYVLPHIIASLHKDYPLVKPAITIGNTRDIAELVLTHKIDVGIIEGEFKHDRLTVEPFAKDLMYVVCSPSHRLAKQNQVAISELTEETWIIREVGSGTREATEKMFAECFFQPGNLMEFGSTQIIKESVEAGLGISLLSYWAIRKELSTNNLTVLKVDSMPISREFSVVTPATLFHTRSLDVFLEELHSYEGSKIAKGDHERRP